MLSFPITCLHVLRKGEQHIQQILNGRGDVVMLFVFISSGVRSVMLYDSTQDIDIYIYTMQKRSMSCEGMFLAGWLYNAPAMWCVLCRRRHVILFFSVRVREAPFVHANKIALSYATACACLPAVMTCRCNVLQDRRDLLKAAWGFRCECSRCIEETMTYSRPKLSPADEQAIILERKVSHYGEKLNRWVGYDVLYFSVSRAIVSKE